MRIYFDNNIFQDLKKPENSKLLSLVLESKKANIFCFSEAHLYDLNRDKSDEKFNDMNFMESIVENNCIMFRDCTCFEYLTPSNYYDSFDWSFIFKNNDFFSEDIPFIGILEMLLKNTPLNFSLLISKEELPIDMPQNFRDLLQNPTSFYDFFQAFMEFSEDLTMEQKKFKELIKYLHKNSLTQGIFESLGIEGYDGINIIDKVKFRDSYMNYFQKIGSKKSEYDLFFEMYYGLELFGLVKGKAAKQKMMNLINDAKHAFFGAYCDMVISKDVDFLNKTRFIYELLGIGTIVLDSVEIEVVLRTLKKQAELTFGSIFENLSKSDLSKRIIKVEKSDDQKNEAIYFLLPHVYFSYFDILCHVTSEYGRYYFLTKEHSNLSTGTLVKEVEYVSNRLFEDLGKDSNESGTFQSSEIVDGKWHGRVWRFGQTVIELNFINKMNLTVYPIEYLDNRFKKEKE